MSVKAEAGGGCGAGQGNAQSCQRFLVSRLIGGLKQGTSMMGACMPWVREQPSQHRLSRKEKYCMTCWRTQQALASAT